MSKQNISNASQNTSLMDDLIAIRDELWAEEEKALEVVSGELSNTFAMLDPSLAALFKDLQTASAELSIAQKNGQMTDILKWRVETAESAYQTRLMEVKRNKMIAEAKSNMKNKIDTDMQDRKELHAVSMQQKMNDQFAALRIKRLQEKKKQDSGTWSWLILFMLGYWLANMNQQRLKSQREAFQAFKLVHAR